jgi:hypothetical protein
VYEELLKVSKPCLSGTFYTGDMKVIAQLETKDEVYDKSAWLALSIGFFMPVMRIICSSPLTLLGLYSSLSM